MSVSLENVVRVSVSGPARGLAEVNTSAFAVITDEVPIPADFGDAKVYLNPVGVAEDFGSNSETYTLVNAAFAQNRNMITGGGFVVVIPREQSAAAQPAVLLSEGGVNLLQLTADDYNVNAAVDGGSAGDLLIGSIDLASVETVEDSLNSTAVTSAGLVFTVTGELGNASIKLATVSSGATSDITIGSAGTGTDIALILGLSGTVTGAAAGVERIKDAILRTVGKIPYFGVCYNEKMTDALLEETAATVQSLNIFQVVGSNVQANIAGIFTDLKDAGYTKTRCLFYSESEIDALTFAAGYMSILMSINFEGTGTALTMNLKDFVGLTADSLIDDNLLNSAKKAGVDVLADIGIPKIFSHGANQYADQMYTRLALTVDLQIAGFNFLATTNTKIPQTEEGMTGLKGAYRAVMNRYVNAGVYAPGTWNDPTTFGPSPDDQRRNIEERGYFIYSQPVAQQSQTSRNARVAPLVQIAAKEAGAIHSSDVTVLVEP